MNVQRLAGHQSLAASALDSAEDRAENPVDLTAGPRAAAFFDLDDETAAAGPRAAAFFDLDKTVVARSSALAFSRPLYRDGLLTRSVVFKVAYAQLMYQLFGADERKMERSRIASLELTRGWDAERVQRLIRETLQQIIDPLIYAEALELFEQHRRAGRELYLVSSTGVEVVEPLAEYLGVPHVIATRAGIDAGGRYDGTLEFYAYGPAKAAAIAEEAERRGLDLAASFAYSDSATDLPMLAAVGHPVAVNPDRGLRLHAVRHGWEIRDFVHPVSLRSRLERLPKPAPEVLAGVGAVGLAAVAGWVLHQRAAGKLTPALAPAGAP